MSRLAELEAQELPADREVFTKEVLPQVRELDESLRLESASLQLHFGESPTATTLARSLGETDREARRVATALERGVGPESLYGRGVRLLPTKEGLVVDAARRGSLDVDLVFGGIYVVLTSQPVSFVLNFAAVLGYGRAAVRAILPGGKRRKGVIIKLPSLSEPNDSWEGRLSPPGTELEVPETYTEVRVRMRSTDGSEIEVDCSR